MLTHTTNPNPNLSVSKTIKSSSPAIPPQLPIPLHTIPHQPCERSPIQHTAMDSRVRSNTMPFRHSFNPDPLDEFDGSIGTTSPQALRDSDSFFESLEMSLLPITAAQDQHILKGAPEPGSLPTTPGPTAPRSPHTPVMALKSHAAAASAGHQSPHGPRSPDSLFSASPSLRSLFTPSPEPRTTPTPREATDSAVPKSADGTVPMDLEHPDTNNVSADPQSPRAEGSAESGNLFILTRRARRDPAVTLSIAPGALTTSASAPPPPPPPPPEASRTTKASAQVPQAPPFAQTAWSRGYPMADKSAARAPHAAFSAALHDPHLAAALTLRWPRIAFDLARRNPHPVAFVALRNPRAAIALARKCPRAAAALALRSRRVAAAIANGNRPRAAPTPQAAPP
ncbi:hypothetical protein VTK26DRAFT_757 [Humicola hyalothermophila]